MKTIGLIGGMSWESSRLYYTLINERIKEKLGGSHSSQSLMLSVDFNEIERLTFENKWDQIGEKMATCAAQLERGGADIILLCTNTIHLVSNFIVERVSIPFLHIAEATGQEIATQKLKKVALLGTKFTMEKDFYTHILEKQYGLQVMIPEESARQEIHDIIYNELVLGVFTDTSRNKCKQIIERMVQAGAEGIILGCTELPLLVPANQVSIPTFDTARIHAHKGVDWAIAENTISVLS